MHLKPLKEEHWENKMVKIYLEWDWERGVFPVSLMILLLQVSDCTKLIKELDCVILKQTT